MPPSAIASQLSLNATLHGGRKTNASFLFHKDQAADIDTQTIFNLARNGLTELCQEFPIFARFQNTIFKEIPPFNYELSKFKQDIKAFLYLVSPIFLRKDVHKCFEFLIRAYSVQEKSIFFKAIIACVLPYSSTALFPKVLTLLNLRSAPLFRIFELGQRSQVAVARLTIAQHCIQNEQFYQYLLKYSFKLGDAATLQKKLEAVNIQGTPPTNGTFVSFITLVIIDMLTQMNRSNQRPPATFVKHTTAWVLRGLTIKNEPNFPIGAYMVLTMLSNLVTFDRRVSSSILLTLISSIPSQSSLDALSYPLLTLVAFFHSQSQMLLPHESPHPGSPAIIPLSAEVITMLSDIALLPNALQMLTKQQNIQAFLSAFALGLVRALIVHNKTVNVHILQLLLQVIPLVNASYWPQIIGWIFTTFARSMNQLADGTYKMSKTLSFALHALFRNLDHVYPELVERSISSLLQLLNSASDAENPEAPGEPTKKVKLSVDTYLLRFPHAHALRAIELAFANTRHEVLTGTGTSTTLLLSLQHHDPFVRLQGLERLDRVICNSVFSTSADTTPSTQVDTPRMDDNTADESDLSFLSEGLFAGQDGSKSSSHDQSSSKPSSDDELANIAAILSTSTSNTERGSSTQRANASPISEQNSFNPNELIGILLFTLQRETNPRVLKALLSMKWFTSSDLLDAFHTTASPKTADISMHDIYLLTVNHLCSILDRCYTLLHLNLYDLPSVPFTILALPVQLGMKQQPTGKKAEEKLSLLEDRIQQAYVQMAHDDIISIACATLESLFGIYRKYYQSHLAGGLNPRRDAVPHTLLVVQQKVIPYVYQSLYPASCTAIRTLLDGVAPDDYPRNVKAEVMDVITAYHSIYKIIQYVCGLLCSSSISSQDHSVTQLIFPIYIPSEMKTQLSAVTQKLESIAEAYHHFVYKSRDFDHRLATMPDPGIKPRSDTVTPFYEVEQSLRHELLQLLCTAFADVYAKSPSLLPVIASNIVSPFSIPSISMDSSNRLQLKPAYTTTRANGTIFLSLGIVAAIFQKSSKRSLAYRTYLCEVLVYFMNTLNANHRVHEQFLPQNLYAELSSTWAAIIPHITTPEPTENAPQVWSAAVNDGIVQLTTSSNSHASNLHAFATSYLSDSSNAAFAQLDADYPSIHAKLIASLFCLCLSSQEQSAVKLLESITPHIVDCSRHRVPTLLLLPLAYSSVGMSTAPQIIATRVEEWSTLSLSILRRDLRHHLKQALTQTPSSTTKSTSRSAARSALDKALSQDHVDYNLICALVIGLAVSDQPLLAFEAYKVIDSLVQNLMATYGPLLSSQSSDDEISLISALTKQTPLFPLLYLVRLLSKKILRDSITSMKNYKDPVYHALSLLFQLDGCENLLKLSSDATGVILNTVVETFQNDSYQKKCLLSLTDIVHNYTPSDQVPTSASSLAIVGSILTVVNPIHVQGHCHDIISTAVIHILSAFANTSPHASSQVITMDKMKGVVSPYDLQKVLFYNSASFALSSTFNLLCHYDFIQVKSTRRSAGNAFDMVMKLITSPIVVHLDTSIRRGSTPYLSLHFGAYIIRHIISQSFFQSLSFPNQRAIFDRLLEFVALASPDRDSEQSLTATMSAGQIEHLISTLTLPYQLFEAHLVVEPSRVKASGNSIPSLIDILPNHESLSHVLTVMSKTLRYHQTQYQASLSPQDSRGTVSTAAPTVYTAETGVLHPEKLLNHLQTLLVHVSECLASHRNTYIDRLSNQTTIVQQAMKEYEQMHVSSTIDQSTKGDQDRPVDEEAASPFYNYNVEALVTGEYNDANAKLLGLIDQLYAIQSELMEIITSTVFVAFNINKTNLHEILTDISLVDTVLSIGLANLSSDEESSSVSHKTASNYQTTVSLLLASPHRTTSRDSALNFLSLLLDILYYHRVHITDSDKREKKCMHDVYGKISQFSVPYSHGLLQNIHTEEENALQANLPSPSFHFQQRGRSAHAQVQTNDNVIVGSAMDSFIRASRSLLIPIFMYSESNAPAAKKETQLRSSTSLADLLVILAQYASKLSYQSFYQLSLSSIRYASYFYIQLHHNEDPAVAERVRGDHIVHPFIDAINARQELDYHNQSLPMFISSMLVLYTATASYVEYERSINTRIQYILANTPQHVLSNPTKLAKHIKSTTGTLYLTDLHPNIQKSSLVQVIHQVMLSFDHIAHLLCLSDIQQYVFAIPLCHQIHMKATKAAFNYVSREHSITMSHLHDVLFQTYSPELAQHESIIQAVIPQQYSMFSIPSMLFQSALLGHVHTLLENKRLSQPLMRLSRDYAYKRSATRLDMTTTSLSHQGSDMQSSHDDDDNDDDLDHDRYFSTCFQDVIIGFMALFNLTDTQHQSVTTLMKTSPQHTMGGVIQNHYHSLGIVLSQLLTIVVKMLSTMQFTEIFTSTFNRIVALSAQPSKASKATGDAMENLHWTIRNAFMFNSVDNTISFKQYNLVEYRVPSPECLQRVLLLLVNRIQHEKDILFAESFVHLVGNASSKHHYKSSLVLTDLELDYDFENDSEDDDEDGDESGNSMARKVQSKTAWLASIKKRRTVLFQLIPHITALLIEPLVTQFKDTTAPTESTRIGESHQFLEHLHVALLSIDELIDLSCIMLAPHTDPRKALAAMTTTGNKHAILNLPLAIIRDLLSAYGLVFQLAVISSNMVFAPEHKGDDRQVKLLSADGVSTSPWLPLLSSALMCCSTLAARTGYQSLEFVNKTTTFVLALLNKTCQISFYQRTSPSARMQGHTELFDLGQLYSTEQVEILQLSSLSMLDTLLRTFANFLSSSMPQIIFILMNPTLPSDIDMTPAQLRALSSSSTMSLPSSMSKDANPLRQSIQSISSTSAQHVSSTFIDVAKTSIVSSCFTSLALYTSPTLLMPVLLNSWNTILSMGAIATCRYFSLIKIICHQIKTLTTRAYSSRSDMNDDHNDYAMADFNYEEYDIKRCSASMTNCILLGLDVRHLKSGVYFPMTSGTNASFTDIDDENEDLYRYVSPVNSDLATLTSTLVSSESSTTPAHQSMSVISSWSVTMTSLLSLFQHTSAWTEDELCIAEQSAVQSLVHMVMLLDEDSLRSFFATLVDWVNLLPFGQGIVNGSSTAADASSSIADAIRQMQVDIHNKLPRVVAFCRVLFSLTTNLKHIFIPYLLDVFDLFVALLYNPRKLILYKPKQKQFITQQVSSIPHDNSVQSTEKRQRTGKKSRKDTGLTSSLGDEAATISTPSPLTVHTVWHGIASIFTVLTLNACFEIDTVFASSASAIASTILPRDQVTRLIFALTRHISVAYRIRLYLPPIYHSTLILTTPCTESLTQALIPHDNRAINDLAYSGFIDTTLIPCLTKLSVYLKYTNPAAWDTLTQGVVVECQNESPIVRFAAASVLFAFIQENKEEYLLCLPKIVPCLAELMQDPSLHVQRLSRDIIKVIEQISGESFPKHLRDA